MTSKPMNLSAEVNQLIQSIYATSLDPSKWNVVVRQLDRLGGNSIAGSMQSTCSDVEWVPGEAMSRAKDTLIQMVSDLGNQRYENGANGQGDPELLQMLDEHVLQAIRIAERISAINQQQNLLQHAFDRLSDAVFFLGRSNNILIANRTASALTEAEDGLQAVNGVLTATHRPTADKLRDLVARVAAKETGKAGKQFDALPIPKPSGGRPLHLLAMPAVTSMEEHFIAFLSGKPSAFIVVSDPDRQPAPPEHRLRAIFGLTPAEAKLAAALASGTSVGSYAADVGITENTVRWTLKQVQAKTDCRRQTDLVRLLAATSRVS